MLNVNKTPYGVPVYLSKTLVLLSSTLLLANSAFCDESVPAKNHDNKIIVSGDSTLHHWTMESSDLKSELVLTSPVHSVVDLENVQPEKLVVRIPAESLKSGKGDMDDKAYEALKSDKNPEIIFTLSTLKPIKEKTTATSVSYQAQGDLQIAGTTKSVSLEATVTPNEDGSLSVVTGTAIDMTEYDMEPPSAMMGMITADEKVDVKIEGKLAQ
ncbi:MAG: YceI family protein [bacterium]|nr:YceI family protein [bacterium]